MSDKPVIVITRNSKTIVITSWRARLAAIGLAFVLALGLVVAACLMLGVILTLATVLLFGIPLAIVLVVVWEWVRSLRSR
jgi:hypothetical protein